MFVCSIGLHLQPGSVHGDWHAELIVSCAAELILYCAAELILYCAAELIVYCAVS